FPEIVQQANTYLTIHWRLREYSINPGAIDFADNVEHCVWGPLTLSEIDLIEGDLGIGGERIDRVSEDCRRETLSIVQERHQALNWLLGFAPAYSEVATDT